MSVIPCLPVKPMQHNIINSESKKNWLGLNLLTLYDLVKLHNCRETTWQQTVIFTTDLLIKTCFEQTIRICTRRDTREQFCSALTYFTFMLFLFEINVPV